MFAAAVLIAVACINAFSNSAKLTAEERHGGTAHVVSENAQLERKWEKSNCFYARFRLDDNTLLTCRIYKEDDYSALPKKGYGVLTHKGTDFQSFYLLDD